MISIASTRSSGAIVPFSTALTRGLADDGGLYVPLSWPTIEADGSMDLPALAERIIAPFAAGDPIAMDVRVIVREAFNFPAPLEVVDASRSLRVLELFHGPTAAFKDFGARFLAATLARLRNGAPRPLRILVATSGDTGGAVAAAFHRQPGIEVIVLFPKGLVSPTQERQLTCWGDNVRSFAVRGTFDDCQRMTKAAFADAEFSKNADLSSANSINLGRLLPQTVYYAAASLCVKAETGAPASFVIPSGNLGNGVACVWARKMGFPIDRIMLAHNANRTVPDFIKTGKLEPRPSIATLASAMDVGDPSNLERLRTLYPDISALREAVRTTSITDAQISARIREDYQRYGRAWCPHTAVAAEAHAQMDPSLLNDERGNRRNWVIVATAHPAKFSEIVTPLIGRAPETPKNLADLMEREVKCEEIDGDLAALMDAIE